MPGDGDSEIRRAEALLRAGEPARALASLQPRLASAAPGPAALKVAGRALNNLGRLDEAAAAFRQASELAPEDADSLASLGHVLARQGDGEAAERAWQAALSVAPDHLPALRGLARLYAASRRLPEAAELLRRVTALAPDDPDAWLNLGELCQFLDAAGEAERAYRRAAALAPERADIPAALGRLRYANGRTAAAERAYARALAIDPQLAAAAGGRALCLEVLGRREEGLALLAPLLERSRVPALVEYAAGRLLAGAGRYEEAARRLARAVESDDPDVGRNPAPGYEYGRVLEKLGRYDEAFRAWAAANRLKPAVFDVAAFDRRVAGIIARYPSEAPPAASGAAAATPRPLFIVGMPRTGTTLVEQMLACHPKIEAGGERLILERMAANLWEAHGRAGPAGEEERRSLRRRWRRGIGPVDPAVSYYTDKFPGNFLHLGLARAILPGLEIVWCRREPADAALSIFATDFNRHIVPWATRLEHIAAAWRAQERLMRHWRDTVGLPVTEIRYESLVAEPEPELRRLLDALALEWDPACLEFHASGRLANTASFDQVRQPLYASSIGRARRFAGHLDPFLRAISV